MAVELRMPKLGMTMKKGTVAKWLKTEGEAVSNGEPVVEVLTEKITAQIESPGAGVLMSIVVPAKQEVPVGTTLAWIAAAGEEVPSQGTELPTVTTSGVASALTAVVVDEDGRVKASPAARRLAKEHGVDISLVIPSGSDGRISSDDVLAFVATRQEEASPERTTNASDAAKRLAQERGVDLATLAARLGNNRRIITEDVQAFLESRNDQEPPISPTVRPIGLRKTIPLVGMRKSVAEHLVQSLHNAAQLSVSIEVDATEMVRTRETLLPGFEVATGVRLTYTDLLIVLVTRALQQNSLVNSTLVDDEVLLHDDVDVGVAVAIEDGLIVPVIRKAQTKSLGEIARARADLARKAIERRLTYEDVYGGTFTISNPGGVGSDISTPILNSPQNAILGVGRIVKKPVVHDDEICVRQMFWLSVTFDHRAMDGTPIARFLHTLDKMIQDPLKHLGVSGI